MSTETSTVRSNYALHLQSSLKTAAVARAERAPVKQFITVAGAEKLWALRTAT